MAVDSNLGAPLGAEKGPLIRHQVTSRPRMGERQRRFAFFFFSTSGEEGGVACVRT